MASAVCFTLRLHTSAAPPRGGLTQALGGEKHLVVVLLAVAVNRLRSALLFGYVLGAFPLRLHRFARSYFACVTFAGFGCNRSLSFHVAAPEPVTSDRSSGKVARRAHECGLRFSASSPGLHPRWLPSRLTIRSSRPRVVASATCFALRLHVSTAPPQGGLTPALGGRKHFAVFLVAAAVHPLRPELPSGKILGSLPLRSSPPGALTCCTRCACQLRKLWLAFCLFDRFRYGCFGDYSWIVRGARSSVMVSAFGKFAKASPSPASFPPNKSFKPTPCRGVGLVPTLR